MKSLEKKMRFNTVKSRMDNALVYFDSPGYTLEAQAKAIPVWNSLLLEYRDLYNELLPSDDEVENGFRV